MSERCAICGCQLHRAAITYARPDIADRSHATKHYYVAERFFGRSRRRRGASSEGILSSCPWNCEGGSGIVCYECHKELLRNPVLLPGEISKFADLVKRRGLSEEEKTESRASIAGRVVLLQEVIALGIAAALRREAIKAHKQSARELTPFLGGFAAVFLLVGFSPWLDAYSSTDSIAIEGWVFFLAGLLACALASAHPFRAAFLGTVGVFVGTAAGIIVHSIIGSQRELFPIEIVSHTGMSAPSFLLSALVWKAGLAPIFWDVSEFRQVVDARIAAKQLTLLGSLSADIEALKSSDMTSGSQGTENTIRGVVAICTTALDDLGGVVLAQYGLVLAEPLVISSIAVEGLVRGTSDQLRPLFERCIAHVRRETNLAGAPNATAECIAILEAKFDAICDDIAASLRARFVQRNRRLVRSLGSPVFEWFAKLLGDRSPMNR